MSNIKHRVNGKCRLENFFFFQVSDIQVSDGWRPIEIFHELSLISMSESQKTFGLIFGLNVGHHSIKRFDYLINLQNNSHH